MYFATIETTISLSGLILTALSIIISVACMVIIGWINIRTKIVSLEIKVLDMESRIYKNEQLIAKNSELLPMMKEEIIERLNILHRDLEVIKTKVDTKRNN